MAKPIDETAMKVLLDAFDAKNTTYAPGIEVARVDAAEAVLKLATPDETKPRDAAIKFLTAAMQGQVPSLGAALRTRAAAILLRHARGVL